MTSKEALKILRGFNEVELNNDKNITKLLKLVKKDLDVLEIFKKKEILQHTVKTAKNVNTYNFVASKSGYDKLTEKQFDLLKKFYEAENDK